MAQTRAPFHWKGTHDPLTTSLSHDILLHSHTLFLDRKWSEISDVAISLGFFFFSSTKLFFFQMNIFLFEYRQDKSVAEMMFSGSHQTQNFLCSCLRVVFPRAVSRVIHSLFAKLRQKFFFGRKRDEFGKLLSSRNCNFADSRVTISSGWNLSFFSFFFYGFPLIS